MKCWLQQEHKISWNHINLAFHKICTIRINIFPSLKNSHIPWALTFCVRVEIWLRNDAISVFWSSSFDFNAWFSWLDTVLSVLTSCVRLSSWDSRLVGSLTRSRLCLSDPWHDLCPSRENRNEIIVITLHGTIAESLIKCRVSPQSIWITSYRIDHCIACSEWLIKIILGVGNATIIMSWPLKLK